jgi:hypothetical protein
MLTAAEISLPTGNLVNGAYDSFGNYYSLPEWVVSDSQNMVEDEIDKDELASAAVESDKEDDINVVDATDDETQRRRDEKGKGVVDSREQIQLRARLSENGQDITVAVDKADPVKAVVRKIASASAVCPNTPGLLLQLCHDANSLPVAFIFQKDSPSLHGQNAQRKHAPRSTRLARWPYCQRPRV